MRRFATEALCGKTNHAGARARSRCRDGICRRHVRSEPRLPDTIASTSASSAAASSTKRLPRPDDLKPEVQIEGDRLFVLGRDLQRDPPRPGRPKALHRFQDEGPAETPAAMLRDDADVLDAFRSGGRPESPARPRTEWLPPARYGRRPPRATSRPAGIRECCEMSNIRRRQPARSPRQGRPVRRGR